MRPDVGIGAVPDLIMPIQMHLRYISISHHVATVAQRERFHIAETDKKAFLRRVQQAFPDITGLMLLVTCNRTELFFESSKSKATDLRDFLLKDTLGETGETEDQLFFCCDKSAVTLEHLLRVASGLESSVIGDAEIIHQVRAAFHISVELQLQGSLLERSMQTVFRAHKRIRNETAFQDGTTSTAYKALKLIRESDRSKNYKNKRILLVGAGDIIQNVLKYNSKFRFRQIWISNRTESKAARLAADFRLKIMPWSQLLENRLESLDVIISAASNAPRLISKGIATGTKVLLIDLAVPGNIAKDLASQKNVIRCDLDTISAQLDENRAHRKAAIRIVKKILAQEQASFIEWLAQEPMRELLAERMLYIRDELAHRHPDMSQDELRQVSNRLVRKLLKDPETLADPEKSESLLNQVIVHEKSEHLWASAPTS